MAADMKIASEHVNQQVTTASVTVVSPEQAVEWYAEYHKYLGDRQQQQIKRLKRRKQQEQLTDSNLNADSGQLFEQELKRFPKLKEFLNKTEAEETKMGISFTNFYKNNPVKFLEKTEFKKTKMKISFANLHDHEPIEDETQIKLLKLLFSAIKNLEWERVQEIIELDVNLNIIANIDEYSIKEHGDHDDRYQRHLITTALLYTLSLPTFADPERISSLDIKKASYIITDLILAGCSLDVYPDGMPTKEEFDKEEANLGRSIMPSELQICGTKICKGNSELDGFKLNFLHQLAFLALKRDEFCILLNFVIQHKPHVNIICNGATPLMLCLLSAFQPYGNVPKLPDINYVNLLQTIRMLLQAGKHIYRVDMANVRIGDEDNGCYDIIQLIRTKYRHQIPS